MKAPTLRLLALTSAVLALAPAAFAVGGTTDWNGATDSNWQNSANWSNGVPTAAWTVNFLNGNPAVISSGTSSIAVLNANGSANLTVTNSVNFSTSGLSFIGGTGNGTVTINAGSSWNASNHGIFIGDYGTGTINLQNSLFTAGNLYLGWNPGSSGTINIDSSNVATLSTFEIGNQGTGRVTVTNDGYIDGNVRVGQSSGHGWLTLMNGLSSTATSDSKTITLDNNGTLNGNSIVNSAVTANAGSHIAAGDTYTDTLGQLQFDNSLTLQGNSYLDFTLSDTQATYLAMGGGALTVNGTVRINLSNYGDLAYNTYTLLDFTNAGSVTGVNLTNIILGNTDPNFDFTLQIVGTQLQVVASAAAIPEPSTYAMIAGIAALGLAAIRRRRLVTA